MAPVPAEGHGEIAHRISRMRRPAPALKESSPTEPSDAR